MDEVGSAEVGIAEIRTAAVRLEEVDGTEVRLAEVRPAKVRITEVRTSEVRIVEVRSNFWIFFPPLIPPCNTLFQNRLLFFIPNPFSGHRVAKLPTILATNATTTALIHQVGSVSISPSLSVSASYGYSPCVKRVLWGDPLGFDMAGNSPRFLKRRLLNRR